MPLERVEVTAYTVPTDSPESDGTLEWDSTTVVVIEVEAGGEHGLGFTYGDESAARLAAGRLARVVEGLDATAVPAAWRAWWRPFAMPAAQASPHTRSRPSTSRSGT